MKTSVFTLIRWPLLAGLFAAGLQAGTPARGSMAGDLTGPWQLLIDDAVITEKTGVVRRYHAFKKHSANPVLIADRPWEGKVVYLYGTVLPAETGPGYRMWYHAWADREYRNLYATSQDGVRWEKPALGLREFGGSMANNLLFRRTREDHMPQVIATPWENDPARRYKMINYDYGRTKPDNLVSGFRAGYSADGIHWSDAPRNPVLPDVGDVANFIWDARKNKYVGYTKVFAPVHGYRRRAIGYTATADFETWNPAELILVPDKFDDRWVTQDKQHTDFYGLSAFPYESGYVGLLWIFRITDGGSDGPILVELVSSRDGVAWQRQEGDRNPILELGPEGAWDAGMIFTPNHPLVEGDTIKLFYGGFGGTHAAKQQTAGIGVATLRKDGFASLAAGAVAGTITTKPWRHLEGELRVNAAASGGAVKAEILDRDGRVLPGYSLADCVAVTGDGVDQPVAWRGRSQLPEPGGELAIRFELVRSSLYSFRAGDRLQLAEGPKSEPPLLTFDDETWRSRLSLQGQAAIESDPDGGTRALVLKKEGDVSDIVHTAHLGREFTLAARVKTSRPQLARIFSTHRGTGDFVTGELVFDLNPRSGVLRFVVNGQRVQSTPRYCGDKAWHHYAVTYANGQVTLYQDGLVVGSGRIRQGSAHLFNRQSVVDHFGPVEARSEVGVHLAADLRIGEDQGGRFMTNKEEDHDAPTEQLVGSVDDVLVVRRVLSAEEVRALAR